MTSLEQAVEFPPVGWGANSPDFEACLNKWRGLPEHQRMFQDGDRVMTEVEWLAGLKTRNEELAAKVQASADEAARLARIVPVLTAILLSGHGFDNRDDLCAVKVKTGRVVDPGEGLGDLIRKQFTEVYGEEAMTPKQEEWFWTWGQARLVDDKRPSRALYAEQQATEMLCLGVKSVRLWNQDWMHLPA